MTPEEPDLELLQEIIAPVVNPILEIERIAMKHHHKQSDAQVAFDLGAILGYAEAALSHLGMGGTVGHRRWKTGELALPPVDRGGH